MALSKQYSQEQLNFFRVCHVTIDLIPEGLRKVFKQEWNARHGASLGPWQDTAKNGQDFYNMTTPGEKKLKKKELSIMKNGNAEEWDCTCLFYSILYLNCIGNNALDPTVKKSVDSPRQFRNTVFGHAKEGRIIDSSFKTSMQDVINAFKDLKLDPSTLEEIRDETSFITAELSDVQQKWEEEKKKNEEPSCFCVLPSKPSHDTLQRDREVSNICREIERLKSSHPGEITMTYLSGNPGSGKSVLARQVGRRLYYENDKDVTSRFVMTLDGSSLQSLIQSYSDLARNLSCDENAITSIITSKQLPPEQQLFHLQGLASPRINLYTTWLLIIDNVEDLKSISRFILREGQPSENGHILITTQDCRSIPTSGDRQHFSLSNGMDPDDAVEMLVSISKADKHEDTFALAAELDYQPLALACAAVFMQSASRTDPSMDWKKCRESIKDELEITERNYKDTSLTYTKSMTTAVRMAIEKEKEKEAMMYAFQFLSVMAPDYVPLKVVVDYVKQCAPRKSKHDITTDIIGSSLILPFTEDEIVTSIRIHQVVYKAIQMSCAEKASSNFWLSIINVFTYLQDLDYHNTDYIAATRPLVGHFVILSQSLNTNVMVESLNTCSFQNMENDTFILAQACIIHGKCNSAKMLLQMTMERAENIYGKESTHIAYRLNGLGLVLRDLGDYENAKVYFERALAIEECNYDKNHPTIATTFSNLGLVLRDLGDYENAKVHLARALAVQECNYDKNHPTIATTLSNLELVLGDLGDYENARVHLARALAIEECNYDKNHPTIATTSSKLGL